LYPWKVGVPRELSFTVSLAAWPTVARRTHSPLPLDQAVMMVAAGSALVRIQLAGAVEQRLAAAEVSPVAGPSGDQASVAGAGDEDGIGRVF